MAFKGGYNLPLKGKPSAQISTASLPDILYLPLRSKRLCFSQLHVTDGADITVGTVLATDPDHFSVPLLAPVSGKVDLTSVAHHIVLKKMPHQEGEKSVSVGPPLSDSAVIDEKRSKLLRFGAWHYLSDAFTGEIPDPAISPQAVIITTVNLEPFSARGDVLLGKEIKSFLSGLEQVQKLIEYQPIYLAVPRIHNQKAKYIRDMLKGYAWINVVEVPLKYPFDNFRLLARRLKLNSSKDAGPIWALRVDGVLAIDKALSQSSACVSRTVAVGGPVSENGMHLELPYGYPLELIRSQFAPEEKELLIIDGGVFSGTFARDQRGTGPECDGITLVTSEVNREFLSFMRPGIDRRSYSNCFASALLPAFPQKMTNAIQGEKRPCVACGFCAEVCPSRIYPYLIHKLMYREALEEAEKARPELCINCGLCSYVCPSKIDLRKEITETCMLINQIKEDAGQEI